MIFVLEWPLTQAARLLRRPEEDVRGMFEKATRRLRHPGLWQSLNGEFDGGRISVSAEVRGWVRDLCEAAVLRCPQCEEPFLLQQLTSPRGGGRGGRPRRFCSNACRQAAYRRRRAAAEPETAPVLPPRLLGSAKPPRSRLAICTEYRDYVPELGGMLLLRCLLFRGHGGQHCALAGVAEEEHGFLVPAWIRWERGSSGTVAELACAMCALPRGHAGVCIHDLRLWAMPYAAASTALSMDREMLQAVRVRLSFPAPEAAVPAWRRGAGVPGSPT
ncbi:hypothetical protein [Streptomyces sp. F001]|uniref:hypothetical protein n=1 Tax=Streptomyces sp. F001 TaxID=1510026 RepID=UPI00101E708B|nr:hypothetical protein [Streptomyces sp. F001]